MDRIASVMGAAGLRESFRGVPDAPENSARFTASDEAQFSSGAILLVDGGRTIRQGRTGRRPT